MEIPELSPAQVAERLQAEDDAVYLDVRTEQEFADGRPARALNVPIFHLDRASGVPEPNRDFLTVCEAHLDKDAPIYVGCASGQRSRQAAAFLLRAGYERVTNVDAGFSGKKDPLGNLVAPGWQQLELPLERGDAGERSYARLAEAV